MTRPLLLFAPGHRRMGSAISGPSSSRWMRAWRERLLALGDVTVFDYPYASPVGSPDLLPKLITAHREALAEARQGFLGPVPGGGEPSVVLVGKAGFGTLVGCHVALEENVQALVCLGYPLRAGKGTRPDAEVLLKLQTPILFVHGERDARFPPHLLAEARTQMSAPSELHVVEDANHNLEVPNRQSQEDVNREIVETIGAFIRSYATPQ